MDSTTPLKGWAVGGAGTALCFGFGQTFFLQYSIARLLSREQKQSTRERCD
jgi:hypothetical protein